MKKTTISSKHLIGALMLIGAWFQGFSQNSAIETVAIMMQQDTMIHEDNVRAVEQIEKARENEKTGNWAKMWYFRGRLYLSIAMSNDEETKKAVGDPLNLAYESLMKVEQGEKAGRYLDDSKPLMFQTAYQLYNEAYEANQAGNNVKAIKNYQKIIDILKYDTEGELMRRANISKENLYKYSYALQMNDAVSVQRAAILTENLPNSSNDSFDKDQIDRLYESTLKHYDQFKDVKGEARYSSSNVPKLKALYRNLLESANEYISSLMKMDYRDPTIYIHMTQNYMNLGDTGMALSTIEVGREAFDDNVDIIKTKLDIYLKQGRTQELIEESNKAIELDPNNKILYFVRGVSHDQLGQTEKAIADYEKTIEIDPYYYDAYFNLGATYLNQTEPIINRMNDRSLKLSQKEYDQLAVQVDELYIKALPYFEKALEVAGDNYAEKVKLATTMKGLYQRLVANYPDYMDKYRAIKQDIKAWEAAAAQAE